MQTQEPPQELPEVELPSAEFIVRLFVIPALIVAGVVGLWLVMGALGGDRADARALAGRIREDRSGWRAAYELANLLRTDPTTAADPRLLAEMTALLDAELSREGAEPRMAEFLALALGSFQTEKAQEVSPGPPLDPLSTLARGLEVGRDPAIRVASAASLARHAARMEGGLDAPGIVGPLSEAALALDVPELRRVATFALGFCGGEAAVEAVRGRLQDDPDPYVRDNAALALARRGDPSALGPMRSMLITDADADSELAATLRSQALAALAKPAAAGLLQDLRSQVEALARSGPEPARAAALRLLRQ